MIEFFKDWPSNITIIVPVPSNNLGRAVKPVSLISASLARITGKSVRDDVFIRRRKITELKNIFSYKERLESLARAYDIEPKSVAGEKILLIDDLYRSGATMNFLTQLLIEKGNAAEVYAFAVTKTRSNR